MSTDASFISPHTRHMMEALQAVPHNAGAAELRRLESRDEGKRITLVHAEEVLRAIAGGPPVGSNWEM
jgi:hypothetical protein